MFSWEKKGFFSLLFPSCLQMYFVYNKCYIFDEFIKKNSSTSIPLLLMTTQEAFVDSVDQDQTAQDVQSDPWSTLSTFSFWIITK